MVSGRFATAPQTERSNHLKAFWVDTLRGHYASRNFPGAHTPRSQAGIALENLDLIDLDQPVWILRSVCFYLDSNHGLAAEATAASVCGIADQR